MKTLYIVDYWVPFPSSEYGGVVNVIAGDDQECFDILQKEREEYHSKYDNLIMQSHPPTHQDDSVHLRENLASEEIYLLSRHDHS